MSHPSPLPDCLTIPPFTGPISGTIKLPGSKSLTNRALLLAALCDRPVALGGALFSNDTELMIEALRALGFRVTADEASGTLKVENQAAAFCAETTVDLFVGLAGTAARFLTALCAASPRGIYRIQGTPRMNERPMKGLIDALRALGADIRCLGAEGFFPIEIHASGLRGGKVEIDATESSQMLSALLMVAPLADRAVEIHAIGGVRWPFVSMTARIMAAFQPGAEDNVELVNDTCFRVRKGGVPAYSAPFSYAIEPDASAASYYAALPFVVGGRLCLEHLHLGLQGDTAFLDVLSRAGATVNATSGGFEVSYDKTQARHGVDENFNAFSDTFLTLAAISPLLSGPTFITGIAHTRRQETDRVAGMAAELRRLGQEVLETEDTLVITPRPLIADVTVRTYHDHRFAMSFGILGCHDLHGNGRPWLSIENPGCCAKTFPHFFDLLESLRRKVSAA